MFMIVKSARIPILNNIVISENEQWCSLLGCRCIDYQPEFNENMMIRDVIKAD